MANRTAPFFGCALLLLAACGESESGPIRVSAVGAEADLVNPNLRELDPASAFLAEAVAQGLVRFDAAGEIEPALAQSWIVSDDGLRYTFRIQRDARWRDGERVTAEQVVRRLQAAISRASRNPLKPMLQVVDQIEAMTDQVLEISLKGPRPNFLQLLAQPELAIVRDGQGTGPYRIGESGDDALRLVLPRPEDEEELEDEEEQEPSILLRGEGAALAVARFVEGEADLVIGGTAGDLPIVRAASPAADALAFNPVAGMFGLVFESDEGLLSEPAARRALSMAVDRQAIVQALNVAGLAPRTSLVPPDIAELPDPTAADWAEMAMPMRRERAARVIAELGEGERVRIRVAMPQGPGYRLIFAHLRRDWRAIGVEAERVEGDGAADLRFIDDVAPADLASWYLHHFTCEESAVCDERADELLQAARVVPSGADRRLLLARAEQLLSGITPFIPIAAPVRWSLRSPRLTGFRTNVFARHPAGELIADTP